MLAIAIVIATVLALFGAGIASLVVGAMRIVRRIRRDKTSMAAKLAAGPAKLVGELRALDPVIALDGSRAVVAQRTLYCKIEKGDEGSISASVSLTECSPIEVCDESGTCVIELCQMLILGHKKHYEFEAERFRERYPTLWLELPRPEAGETVVSVIADEIAVPDGAPGFISGEVTLGDSPARGEAYRGGRRPFRLRGEPRRPLIVSSGDEEAAVRMLLGPMIRVAWISLLCWLVAALARASPFWLTALSAL